MNHAALAKGSREDLLDRRDQSRRAVADDEERRAKSPLDEPFQEVPLSISGLRDSHSEADEVGLAVGVDAPGAEYRRRCPPRPDRLLHEEPDREPADLLDHARQVAVGTEQCVNLCADVLAGGYSWCDGRRSSFVSFRL